MTEFEKLILEKLDKLIEIGMWSDSYKETKPRLDTEYRSWRRNKKNEKG